MKWVCLVIALACYCLQPVAAGAQPEMVGTQFQVNTYTSGYQRHPHVTMAANGRAADFAVTWESDNFFGPTQDGSGSGVFANVFDWNAVPKWANDWQINTYTTGDQTRPRVHYRMNPSQPLAGRLDFLWNSDGQDGDGTGLFLAVFNELYLLLTTGDVGLTGTGNQTGGVLSGIASKTGTDFGRQLVAWENSLLTFSNVLFTLLGTHSGLQRSTQQPLTTQFQANTYTTGNQGRPSACSDPSGNFIIAWSSFGQEGEANYSDIYAQRFDSNNARLGTEFRVNTYTTAGQDLSQVCCSDDGSFLVVWESGDFQPSATPPTQDGSGFGIFGQRYDSGGIPNGTEFQVNTYTTGFQFQASLACDGAGDAVVVWQSSDAPNIKGQAYSGNGSRLGTEFEIVVDPMRTRLPYGPSAAMGPGGAFVVVWSEFGVDGDAGTVLAQRFTLQGIGGSTTTTTVTTTTSVTTTTMPAGICGDPVNAGGALAARIVARAVNATDALLTLKAGVGSEPCALCVCDVNNSGDINATDALVVLQFGVGQPVVLNCPACPGG